MNLRDKSVFIVEDNLQNRVVFHVSLMRHGAYVEFERWGEDAILRLKWMFHVDIIVLDLMLAGGVSGFDIFDKIRSLPKYADIPIVAVSAMDPSVAIPQARAKGFAGFIAKPIDAHMFPQQLGRILDGETLWQQQESVLS